MVRRLLLVVLVLTGCASRHTLVQYSTINALLAGVYDGDMTFGELRRHGDFGIGTFNALDGEMIALDGRYYQIAGDGSVKPVLDDMRTPFAVVTKFQPSMSVTFSNPATLSEFEQALDVMLPATNTFYAIKLTGTFPSVKTRSVPRQQQPYPPLIEATKRQTVFEFHEVTGTLVGFRTPKFMRGLNVPGYHFHFLTADRHAGGHVLDCQITGRVQVEPITEFLMILPKQGAFNATDVSASRGNELETVEKGHGIQTTPR